MEPDICTSLTCTSLGSDYCMKCSHGIHNGSGIDKNGKEWRWEFNPYFGPLFVRKNGEPLSNQPIAPWHRAWKPFEKWLKKHNERIKVGKKNVHTSCSG